MAELRARESFFAFVKGISRQIRAGELVKNNDPVVKGREALFTDASESPVEQATAAPGEKRTVARPKK